MGVSEVIYTDNEKTAVMCEGAEGKEKNHSGLNGKKIKIAERAKEDLCDEDNKLIELRYFKHMTQKETGKTLNMTQVQVSRKEKRILHNIRSKMLC